MTTDRKKPGVAFWATVVVVVALVGYPLSFGPACWLADRNAFLVPAVGMVYKPPVRAAIFGPEPIKTVLLQYAELGAPPRDKEHIMGLWDRWTYPVSIVQTL